MKGDFLPLKIEGDNSDNESVRNMTEDLMFHTVWQQQLCEEDFENCKAFGAIDIYFKREEIPTEDRELYRRLKEAAIEKSKERRLAKKSAYLERCLARKAAYLESQLAVVNQSSNASSHQTPSVDENRDGQDAVKLHS